MKCENCGSEFEGRFCTQCGTKADTESSANVQQPVFAQAEKSSKQKKPFFLRWWFIMIAVIIVCIIALNMGGDGEKIVWDDIILGEMLPEPPASKGEIHTNSADDLWIDINDLSDKQFNDYINACKKKGFTVDTESNSSSYDAFNAEGYKLSLGHYGSDADMSIRLEAPMAMTAITWPTSAAGNQLPIPKSTTGKFSYEYDDDFLVYVGNTSKTDYTEYVNACSQKGFNIDYSKGDDYYYADNSEGWHVDIRYEGNNVMSINIDPPDDESNDNTSTQSNEGSESDTTEVGLDPDFKAAMDSYEKFMDEYVAFMKKYSANPTDMSLLADYADYMSEYADFVDDFNDWQDKEMNAAETAYYIEVQTRVNKKLLEVVEN